MSKRNRLDGYDLMNIFIFGVLVILIVFFTGILILGIYRGVSIGLGKKREITGIVLEKGIKRDGNSDLYLVYVDTDNGLEVLQVSDSLFAMRFNSSDVYGGIREGVKYTFTVRGDRVYFLSWYPNIYEYAVAD